MSPRGRGRSAVPDGVEQLAFDVDALLHADDAPPHADGASGDLRLAVPREPVTGAPHRVPPAPPSVPETRLGALDIAELLGRPAPTPEQIGVIEAPVAPLLVVAGAGSGKTETMAARVVWLVANGVVAPEQVLGLTFTRKAAAELADRVRSRLRALHRRGFVPATATDVATSGVTGGEPQPVSVSTYHAYAATLLGDHGLRLGVDTGSRLLGEAGAWQLVDELVERWDGDMSDVASARTSVVEYVLALAGECAEHLVTTRDVEAAVHAVLDRVAALPPELGDGFPGTPKGPVKEVAGKLTTKLRLIPLVEAYVQRKRELDLLDFGDQVALAAQVARTVPEVGAGERDRFRVVLLDEYQDTSHAQLELLRSLFGGGHPVTAVGDPHQSIYGWRGASAGNLQRFPHDFPARAGGGVVPARVAHLATSWRNDLAVLAAANQVSAELRRPAPWADVSRHVEVPPLAARPAAGAGHVRVEWHSTVEDEAGAVTDFAEQSWQGGASVAVLCRTRAQFPLVEAALRVRGLPVEVVGLGGLLHVPEVADLRAALEVLHDPTRGDSLMRLLTGAAWRLGPRDLDALGAWARLLLRRARAQVDGDPDRDGIELDSVDETSLVEALDELPPAGWVGPNEERLSAAGRDRLSRLADLLRHLRTRTALALPDLVLEVERALLLDVEVAARPGRRPASARANLDAFVDVAAGFAETGDRPTLGGFLGWLAAAEKQERGLETAVTEPRPDAVQVLTVHAAKGLEWDAVAVTGLVEGTFPTGHSGRPPVESKGWLGDIGALPFPVRGDADGLPQWDVAGAASQVELDDHLARFRAACGAHEVAEERRLAYVALTRARGRLLLTGATWGDGSTPRTPSRFLLEVAALADPAGGGGPVERGTWAEHPPEGAANPRDSLTRSLSWPLDPLGPRRSALEAGAALVRAAQDGDLDVDPAVGSDWAREVDALLAERAVAGAARREVELPTHLSASQLVALASDAQRLAARLRRPMPEPPSPASRRGTAFHAWLEQRFGRAALVDVDELPGAADDAAHDDELALLQERFLASEWADRLPEQVEVSIETPVGDLTVRGRIDAVFRSGAAGSGAAGTWDVVDWKTGPPPGSPSRARSVAVQLAVYRLAWSRLMEVDVDRVRAAFFYASTGETVRPVDLLDAAGLEALVAEALGDDVTRGPDRPRPRGGR